MKQMMKKTLAMALCAAILLSGVIAGGIARKSSVASAITGTSAIKSYEELDAEYDNFVYVGTEVYELNNSTLTDYYVQPGDWLEFRTYIKSDLYAGESSIYTLFDNSFFDVSTPTDAAPGDNGYTSDGYAVMNGSHPLTDSNEITTSVVSNASSAVAWMKSILGGTYGDYLSDCDVVYTTTKNDSSFSTFAYDFTSDEWFYSYKVQVKEDLEEGTTALAESPIFLWQAALRDGTTTYDARNRSQVAVSSEKVSGATEKPTISTCKTMASQMNSGVLQNFINDDMTHEFVIGVHPEDVKYKANFIDGDGNTVSCEEYDDGAEIVVPSEVENQVCWVNAQTGEKVDFNGFVMPANDMTFRRVLSTDRFDMTVDLNGGAVDAALLPEYVTDNGDGTMTVKVPFGSAFDLSEVPLPEKEGYTASWAENPVTLDNILGGETTVTWTANTYKATFYLDKGDTEPLSVFDVAYGSMLYCSGANKDNLKFAGWVDAETDELVSSTPRVGIYNYACDKSYYASWTEYDSSVSFMMRDYENGGWKLYTTKYADAGASLNVTTLNQIVNGIKTEVGTTRVVQLYDNPDAEGTPISSKSSMKFDGHKTIYVYTIKTSTVIWRTPVYDEETREFTDEYTEYTYIPSTSYSGENAYSLTVLSTSPGVPAGCEFIGWNDEEGNFIDYGENGVTINFDKSEYVFTANFKIYTCEISFNVNNNGEDSVKKYVVGTFKYGDIIDFSTAEIVDGNGEKTSLPVIGLENSEQVGGDRPDGGYTGQDGYYLSGWTDADGFSFDIRELYEIDWSTELYAPDGKLELYGEWAPQYYDLTFYKEIDNGGQGETAYEQVAKYGAQTDSDIENFKAEAESLVKLGDGYEFIGWFDENGNEIGSTMSAYGMNCYAKINKFGDSVYFYANGGKWADGYSDKKEIVAYGDEISVSEIPVREGYIFAGWKADGVNYGTDLGVMTEGKEYTFYAVWETETTVYTVETYTMGVDGKYKLSTSFSTGKTNESTTYKPEIADGFTLNSEKSVLSGVVTGDGALILKVYIDRNRYTLRTDIDGVIEEKTYYYGETVSVADAPEKEGYAFNGWTPEVPAAMPADDLTLTAVYVKNDTGSIPDPEPGTDPEPEVKEYTVKFIVDGKIYSEKKYEQGKAIAVPAAPEKSGYTFKGWTPEVPATMPANNLTFTAQFEAIAVLNTKLSIKTPSTTTVKYGDTLILHAEFSNLPEGAKIEWSVEGSGASIKASDDGMTCAVTCDASGEVAVTAKAVDKNGNALKNADGNEIGDSQKLTMKAGIFQKIGSFFKNLFGINRIIAQVFTKVF